MKILISPVFCDIYMISFKKNQKPMQNISDYIIFHFVHDFAFTHVVNYNLRLTAI